MLGVFNYKIFIQNVFKFPIYNLLNLLQLKRKTKQNSTTSKQVPIQKSFVFCLFVWWCLTPLSTIVQFVLWRLVLFVEETGGPGENHRPVAGHGQNLSHNVVHLALVEIRTHNISGDRHWLHRSNYHTITATTTPTSIVEWSKSDTPNTHKKITRTFTFLVCYRH